ncbi:cupin domain-containing protein [Sediminibacterium roseum]|uniref:Cupin domain-containing protein n=1 Tax=Sediminibacterium roseum TaxID=1978412 RepID=A0ABX0A0R9_9BACT|nr:cupin domain-containing protein [Sediminibacterium roseum]NCI50840.1 cupin domain-containing protein [Sediminibacterium roseum]
MKRQIHKYYIKENGVFPNNEKLQVLHYRNMINVPLLFAATAVKKLFRQNGWGNNWRAGIFTYDHYHSNTHEAMAVIKGKTTVLLGGKGGRKLEIEKGDVLIIPAGVAHKNLGKENDVVCIGGYPDALEYDMNYGAEDERPKTDRTISKVKPPATDPVFGKEKGLVDFWRDPAA